MESTNLLIAGAIHFAVFVEVADIETPSVDMRYLRGWPKDDVLPLGRQAHLVRFEALKRRRFVSSVQEVVGSEGLNVISNEDHPANADGSISQVAPLRTSTLEELVRHGFEPALRGIEVAAWS